MGQFLVTGGAGFIGAHVASRLLGMGHSVWVVDNLFTGRRENVPDSAEFVELDLSLPDAFAQLPRVRFDAVLHLAAQSSGEISFTDPVYDLQTNVLGTLLLLDWCVDHRIDRFIYASSMSIYGDVGEEPISESQRCQPNSFYGIGKLTSEHYLRLYADKGVQSTAFRMFNVFGPGQNLANLRQGMVSIYLAYLLKGEPIVVKGPRNRFRDFVYIDDVVDAWVAAIGAPQTYGQTYNLASGKRTFVWELLHALIGAAGADPDEYPVESAEGTPGDQFGIWADIGKIRTQLAWTPKTSLEAGLSAMCDWAKRQRSDDG